MHSASLLRDKPQQGSVLRQGGFMSTDRGRRRRTVKRATNRQPQQPRDGVRQAVQLARGFRVERGAEREGVFVLVCADGKVQLNSGAVAILQLCDGSRDRDTIVAELMRGTHRHALAGEIVEFLDAALARGWIVDARGSIAGE